MSVARSESAENSYVEADFDNKKNILFLSWHNPVIGSSACGILLTRLGDLEGKSVSCYVEELQLQILVD